jgi:signal transduction histidine kinase
VEPRRRESEVSRRRASRTYLALGALRGLGAPAGLLVLERALLGRHPRVHAVIALASGDLAIATPLVFGLFGMLLGQREEKVRASVEQLERLREEFAAVVAHDLRGGCGRSPGALGPDAAVQAWPSPAPPGRGH